MIFSFLRDTIRNLGRPATTTEVETEIRGRLPMCTDHTSIHLRELETEKLVEKEFDKNLKAFVWRIPEPYNSMSFHELIENYHKLYKESLYICAIHEMDKNLGFDEIVDILYQLSEGSDTRPAIKKIKDRFAEKFLEKYAK